MKRNKRKKSTTSRTTSFHWNKLDDDTAYHENCPRYENEYRVYVERFFSELLLEINIRISLQEKEVGYSLVQNIRRDHWGTGWETTAVQKDPTHVGMEHVQYIVWRQT